MNKRHHVALRIAWLVLLLFSVPVEAQAGAAKQINIDVTTHLGDVKDFQAGDQVSFLLSLDTDAYVVVVYQDARGDILQLLPNRRMRDYFYKAGLFLRLPDPAAPFAFTIQPPFGRETLWVFAADRPLPELAGSYLKNGLKKLTGDLAAIRKVLAGQARAAYGEASLVLHTRPLDSRQ